jgi:hypothetical protein
MKELKELNLPLERKWWNGWDYWAIFYVWNRFSYSKRI